jgi:predicted tellurium resistance membrane protein TerC
MIQPSDLVTIALLIALEGLLSADNALVIAVMVLGLPKRDHKGALHYGLVGAFAFRIAATLLAVYLIALGWVKLLGGLYLLPCVCAFLNRGSGAERQAPKAKVWLAEPVLATVVRSTGEPASRLIRSWPPSRCRQSCGWC